MTKKKVDIKEIVPDANVTHIHLGEKDFLYIQMERPSGANEKELKEKQFNATKYFDWALEDFGVKFSVEFEPLKFTVISKKEEFVARLNDNIVQL